MRSKALRISAIVAGTLLVILLAGLFLFQQFGPRYTLEFLRDRVEKETNGRYTLTLDSLGFDLLNLSVHLRDLQLERDTAVDGYSGIPLLDKFDLSVQFDSLDVNYFRLHQFVFSNTIKVKEFHLRSPAVTFIKNRSYNPEASEEVARQQAAEQAADSMQVDSILADTSTYADLQESGSVFVPTLIVEDFRIIDASFALYDGRKKEPLQAITGLHLRLRDVHSELDAPFSAEDLSIEVAHASSLLAKNTARLELMGLHITPDTFQIDTLHYGNIINPYRVNRFKGFRAAWLDIVATDLHLEGIHYEKMIADTSLIIDRVTLGEVNLTFFKDKEEKKINPAYKPLPPEMIRSIPLEMEIDTLEVLHANLHVEMQAARAYAPGYINFDDLYLLVTNMTNRPEVWEVNPYMEVYAEGKIMNDGPVEVDFRFNLPSAEDHYQVYASAGPMDVRRINNFVGSQFFIEFGSGYVEEMAFEYEGNNKVNVGQMDLQYRDLKVQKLQDFEKFLDGQPNTGFFSGLGNVFIPNNRSKDQKKYKTAVVYYEKEYNRDVIHGLIQSMLSGVMSSLGLVSKNFEKKLDQAESLTEEDIQASAEKARRQARKAERKKQKEAARARRKAKKEAKKN